MVSFRITQSEFWEMEYSLWHELCEAYKEKLDFFDHQFGATRYLTYLVNAGPQAKKKPEEFLLLNKKEKKPALPEEEEMLRFFQSFSEVL